MHFGYDELVPCIRRFLYDQLYPDAEVTGNQVELNLCPQFGSNLKVYNSATATYYAPGDQSGVGGMHRNIICCMPSWWGGPAQKDTVFVENRGAEGEGLSGLLVARVCLLFLFPYRLKKYQCTLVEWFLLVADKPDDVTGTYVDSGTGRLSTRPSGSRCYWP